MIAYVYINVYIMYTYIYIYVFIMYILYKCMYKLVAGVLFLFWIVEVFAERKLLWV